MARAPRSRKEMATCPERILAGARKPENLLMMKRKTEMVVY
jgi:hypothetical protein